MGFRIRISETALEGFTEIFGYSWEQFPEKTPRFGKALFEHIDLLKAFPNMGRLVLERPGVRMIVHTPLQIYHAIWDNDRVINILEIRHSARRP